MKIFFLPTLLTLVFLCFLSARLDRETVGPQNIEKLLLQEIVHIDEKV